MKQFRISRLMASAALLFSLSVVSNCDPEPPETNNPPVFETVTPGEAREGELYIIDIDATDPDGDVLTYSLTTAPMGMEIAPEDGMIVWTPEKGTAGEHSIVVGVSDSKAAVQQSFTLRVLPAGEAPVLSIINPTDGAQFDEGTAISFSARVEDPEEGDISANVRWSSGGLELGVGASLDLTLARGNHRITATITDSDRQTATSTVNVTIVAVEVPADPATVAPALPETEVTGMKDAVKFLYSGPNPTQTDVDPDQIDEKRVSLVRGKVLNKTNQPLAGVTISVKNHPEFGKTLSRADGAFDLALNGGGYLTLNYTKSGHLPAQRNINVPWRGYVNVEPVVLITLNGNVTTVDLSGGALSMQTARGSVSNDADGERQATVLFPVGTTAKVTLPNGDQQDLSSLNVRLTEYTVGENGPGTMPGSLPASSGYTYAVDLTVDEALAIGGERVDFNQALPLYVDNFLEFPVGEAVPAGYYDYKKSSWVPSDNGRVIGILRIEDDKAVLDVSGSGSDATTAELEALGITSEELTQLAQLYSEGKTLWRTPVKHFTPWDCNWPYGPPDDATPPPNPPKPDEPLDPEDTDTECGCIIEAQNQTLGEDIDLVGSPFKLHYRSNRVNDGRGMKMVIPLSGADLPSSLQSIELTIEIAGRTITRRFSPASNLSYTFIWDGVDTYGRTISQGEARATLTYIYRAVYYGASSEFRASFGRIGRSSGSGGRVVIGGDRATRTIRLKRSFQRTLSNHNLLPKIAGLGAWSLSMHHAYDPVRKVFYNGNGGRRSTSSIEKVVTTLAGGGTSREDGADALQTKVNSSVALTIDAAGNIYYSEYSDGLVRKIDTAGIVSTVAGGGSALGDGGPATEAQLSAPAGLAIGPNGDLYISDTNHHQIRKVDANGIISTVAGNGTKGFSGDDGPAIDAQMKYPAGITLDSQGNLYIADKDNHRIRKVDTSGIISTFQRSSTMTYPIAVWISPEGNLYISGDHQVFRRSPEGDLTILAGNGGGGSGGDGGPATSARISRPQVGPGLFQGDGSFIFADGANTIIRKVDEFGIISTIAGRGSSTEDGVPGGQAKLGWISNILATPSGQIVFTVSDRIRTLVPQLGALQTEGIIIPSADGATLHVFSPKGRHLKTIDAVTNAVLFTFSYDDAGLLSTVTDQDGRIINIERDAGGNAQSITAPDGHRTTLSADSNGHLSAVTNPAGESHTMEYSTGGLMTRYTDPVGNSNVLGYNSDGFLVSDSDPLGGGWTLIRSLISSQSTVTMTSGEGRISTFTVEHMGIGTRKQVTTAPDGTATTSLFAKDGSTTVTKPDGTVRTLTEGPDPRFGMTAPVPETYITTTPGGLINTVTTVRGATLADPNDKLSHTALTETVSINGRSSSNSYDSAGRTWTKTSAAGRVATLTLNTKGQTTHSTVAGLADTNYSYDSAGRLTEITRDKGGTSRTSRIEYYTSGPEKGFLKSLSDAQNRVTTFEYDAAGRISAKTLPDGRILRFSHDAKGNLKSLTTPAMNEHIYQYTKRNQPAEYGPPALPGIGEPATRFEYNLDKQLKRVIRPDGKTIEHVYDAAGGRLTQTLTPRGAYAYGYNAGGLVNEITAPNSGKLSYTHDGNLLLSQSWSGTVSGKVSQSYNNDFVVTKRLVNDAHAAGFDYDQDLLLTRAGDLTLNRDNANGLLNGTSLIGVSTTQTYNKFGEISDYTASAGAQALYKVVYERDIIGRITKKIETVAGTNTERSFQYDLTGRLTGTTKGGQSSTFGYDDDNNRIKENGVVVAQFDAQDRLVRRGDYNFTYNANGDLASRTHSGSGASDTFNYDVMGNITQVSLADGTQIEYIIDGENRRIGKRVNNILTQGFLYKDALNPVAELDGNNQVTARFIYGEKDYVPAYMIKNGATYRIISDQLGSPKLVVDVVTNAVVQRIDYDVWGNVLNDTNPGFQPFGFAGGLHDRQTGLTRFGARDYDARLGRWLTKDPVGPGDTFNAYSYVSQDPLNFTDPLGLWKISVGGTSSFFVGGLGGNASGMIGIDSNFNICRQVTVCGRAGFGASTSTRVAVSAGQGTFCEGNSGSGGFFAGGGFGPFASVSTKTDAKANTSVTLSVGTGAGASGGSQMCMTETFCN